MQHKINFTAGIQRVTKNGVWLTDLHIDAVDVHFGGVFEDLIVDAHPDFVLVGGDISNGVGSLGYLEHLSSIIKQPIYFVLGNHDFYSGSIKRIRQLAMELAEGNPLIHYLSASAPIELNPETVLIGHDGWCDGQEGDFLNSNIRLNDYRLIEELSEISDEERLVCLKKLGQESADFLAQQVKGSFEKYSQVIILTHTPPFKECCLYDNQVTDANWAPHFVCKAMGDMLLKVASTHPDRKILVLCGHSHHKAEVQKLQNLQILTGHSNLGFPTIQGFLEV